MGEVHCVGLPPAEPCRESAEVPLRLSLPERLPGPRPLCGSRRGVWDPPLLLGAEGCAAVERQVAHDRAPTLGCNRTSRLWRNPGRAVAGRLPRTGHSLPVDSEEGPCAAVCAPRRCLLGSR